MNILFCKFTGESDSEKIFKKSVENVHGYLHEFGLSLFWNTVYTHIIRA